MANDKRVKLVSFTGSTQVIISLFVIVFDKQVSFTRKINLNFGRLASLWQWLFKIGRSVLNPLYQCIMPLKRWGKHLLELGGNNALIVNNDADVKMVRLIRWF